MGGQKLTGQLGEDLREYLIQDIGRGKRGSADLCSYFLLRDLVIAPRGRVGIIATNTIAQGDTREVGLDQAMDMGWAIYRAEKSQRWPGTASLEVSLVWTGHPGQHEERILDGNKSGHNALTRSTVEGVRQSISAGRERRPVLHRLDTFLGPASSWNPRKHRI